MAKDGKTTIKRPVKPFTGNEGKTFTADYQPDPEAKKRGWREFRAERHLTQAIIKEMLGTDGKPTESFKSYIASLVTNARKGNPKAIEAVNKFIEEDITQIDLTSGGQPIGAVIKWGDKDITV